MLHLCWVRQSFVSRFGQSALFRFLAFTLQRTSRTRSPFLLALGLECPAQRGLRLRQLSRTRSPRRGLRTALSTTLLSVALLTTVPGLIQTRCPSRTRALSTTVPGLIQTRYPSRTRTDLCGLPWPALMRALHSPLYALRRCRLRYPPVADVTLLGLALRLARSPRRGLRTALSPPHHTPSPPSTLSLSVALLATVLRLIQTRCRSLTRALSLPFAPASTVLRYPPSRDAPPMLHFH